MDQIPGMRFELAEISNLQNYYNERQRILRVSPIGSTKCFDVFLGPTYINPTPSRDMCIVFAPDGFFDKNGIDEFRKDLSPGWSDKTGNLANIPQAVAFLFPKNQEIKVSNPQNGAAAFDISNTNMFDADKVRVSINPGIGKSYTNSTKDSASNKLGIYMNDQTVMIRSAGGSITLGEEGIHLGGKVFLEGGKQGKGIVVDNPIHGIIPQTIPTAIISIPQIPNFGEILQIADTAGQFMEVIKKVQKITELVT